MLKSLIAVLFWLASLPYLKLSLSLVVIMVVSIVTVDGYHYNLYLIIDSALSLHVVLGSAPVPDKRHGQNTNMLGLTIETSYRISLYRCNQVQHCACSGPKPQR